MMAVSRCCGSKVTSAPSAPILFGEADGVVTRVRVLVPSAGLGMYDIHWVTGVGAAARIAAGSFVAV